MWTPRPAQPVLLYMTTYFSFEEIANKHNQHLAGWNDKIDAAKYSRYQGDEAMQWLEDPKNLPSLATINYELANDDHGANSWVEVPDPNPDATEAFKQYYSPQSWDETDKDSRTKEGKKKLKHLQSPLVLYAFLDYTLHNTKGRRRVYAERGFSAGQLVGGFNERVSGLLDNPEYANVCALIDPKKSALIARCLNHLPGNQGWLYNIKERGMNFTRNPLDRRYEIAQNQRYIRVNDRIVQLSVKYKAWKQFFQLYPFDLVDAKGEYDPRKQKFRLVAGYSGVLEDIIFNNLDAALAHIWDLPLLGA
jgi:hypothetical protein